MTNIELHVIDTGLFKLDGGAMFGVVPKSIWQRFHPSDESNLCTWAMRCLLIKTDDRLMLIDTGIGDKQDEKFLSYFHLHGTESLLSSISEKGFQPEDITDVFLTHLHFDHVGGATSTNETGQVVPTFPNATYWSNEKHWQWAMNPNSREKASFLKENLEPIEKSGQLNFLKEGESPLKGVDIRWVNGHTEAQMLPIIKVGDKTIAYMADLIPSVGHLPLPYVMSYDVRPLETLKEKEEILKEALDKDWVLFFEHDPINECCTLKSTPKGVRMDNTFDLKDLNSFTN